MDRSGMLWAATSQACGSPISPKYLTGIRNTLVLAMVATLIGCLIGLAVRHSEHHPLYQTGPYRSSVSF